MENYNFNIIEQSQVGQRIDKLVSDLNKDWSRSQLQDWIKEGLVKVNGKVIKSNYKVKLNDKIVVTEKEVVEADIKPENLNLIFIMKTKTLLLYINQKVWLYIHLQAIIVEH